MVAICPSRARPSPPNDVSRTNGPWRMIDPTEWVVIGSWLVGWSGLVSRFRRSPQPRHRRKNRVPGQRQQELAGDSLLAGAGGGDLQGKLRVQAARYPASGETIDSCRSRTADQCGTPKTKVSTAPALAAREHGRRFSHIDPLFLLVAPQATKVAL